MENKSAQDPHRPLEYDLRKYLLLLATMVATVTYTAGFNPPGGVWQETEARHLAGDSIIRDTHYPRYIMFFYCNAAAFALSIVVIVLIFILAILHEKNGIWISMFPLRLAMVLNLFLWDRNDKNHLEAIGQGTGNNPPNPEHSVGAISPVVSREEGSQQPGKEKEKEEEEKNQRRKVLMLLATFVMSVAYVAGLSAPGGYWERSQEEGRHHADAGDPVLWVHHSVHLRAFVGYNTTSFVASLLIIMLLLDQKQKIIFLPLDMKRKAVPGRAHMLYAYITIALVGLVGAYVAGSCRHSDTTIYALSLVATVLICIGILKVVLGCMPKLSQTPKASSRSGENNENNEDTFRDKTPTNGGLLSNMNNEDDILEKAQSLVVLLSTLIATVTYQAGLVPLGGVWQENQDGHKAGKPILMSTQAKRYKVFFYCNSTAFVASLVIIILVRYKPLLKRHILEVAIILDLFGLVGAYAAGSCQDVSTSIYVITLAGAVLIYVVIHIVFITLEDEDKNKTSVHSTVQTGPPVINPLPSDLYVHKRRKRLLLFSVLGATLTYQAGLTPHGGFRLKDDELSHHAGDPVLLYNYPRRYKAFFYCNSLSFMSSIALIILHVNPNLYRPAIRSYALSVCVATGLLALMSAYAAGSTQHLKTSIYVFALALFPSTMSVAKVKKNDGDRARSLQQHVKHKGIAREEQMANGDERHGRARLAWPPTGVYVWLQYEVGVGNIVMNRHILIQNVKAIIMA
ncbi:hypothetical protein DAI22_06g122800 [Oryza sativa Japonica Group]|nr:hypothetical protein DAI22_06g122800 [Oryza sativa Japonica Group]